MNIQFEQRIFDYQDWAAVLFVLGFLLIAANKNAFGIRFADFLRLAFSDKYIKVYRHQEIGADNFSISMFVMQLISLSFFTLLIFDGFDYLKKTDGVAFLQVFTFITVFILSKYLIEKIIAVTFQLEEFVERFNFVKLSYRTYLCLFLLPLNVILYYNPFFEKWIYLWIGLVLLLINLAIYVMLIRNYQSVLMQKLFYFILYLCALEIAPYYFIYYWITK